MAIKFDERLKGSSARDTKTGRFVSRKKAEGSRYYREEKKFFDELTAKNLEQAKIIEEQARIIKEQAEEIKRLKTPEDQRPYKKIVIPPEKKSVIEMYHELHEEMDENDYDEMVEEIENIDQSEKKRAYLQAIYLKRFKDEKEVKKIDSKSRRNRPKISKRKSNKTKQKR